MNVVNQAIDLTSLVDSIYQGECILMIGPDAITEPSIGGSVSLMELFKNYLIDKRPSDERSQFENLNPAQVAQVYKQRCCDDRALRIAAQDFFGERFNSTTPYLKHLAKLPFKLVIDTTPLRQMEIAFKDTHDKEPNDDWYQKKGQVKRLKEFDVKHPLIYHPFGSVKDSKSLVLAENEFIDLLVEVIKENPPLPLQLCNAFTTESSMLFIGFGVRHLLLRILLHILHSGKSTTRSFALELFNNDFERRAVEGAKLLFQQGQRIDFIDMELDAFTADLSKQYSAHESKLMVSPEYYVKKTAAEPLVFISYCREDEKKSAALRQSLEERGIKIWVDVNDIRAGQDFDPTIKYAIKQQVDYFVLLYTTTLSNMRESYVNREINLANERQMEIAGIFLIPVQMDDVPIISDDKNPTLLSIHGIDTKHVIDGRTLEGLQKLASDINEDFERQEKRKSELNKKTI